MSRENTSAFAWEKIRVLEKVESLSESMYASKDGVTELAYITCEGTCRFKLDGTNPTKEDGHLLVDNGYIILKGDLNIKKFRVINVGDSYSILQVTYER